jgi:hypothetical protein
LAGNVATAKNRDGASRLVTSGQGATGRWPVPKNRVPRSHVTDRLVAFWWGWCLSGYWPEAAAD